MSDEIPVCYNLLPLLSGGKANRTTPIGRWEFPQRFVKPAWIGATVSCLAWVVDQLIGDFLIDWRIIPFLAAGLWFWYRTARARRVRPDVLRFWIGLVVASWALFPVAHICVIVLSKVPVIGFTIGLLIWPLLGAGLSIVSSELQTMSGANRAKDALSRGRSTMIAGRLHLGLWPVPSIESVVQWCDGAVLNPHRARR